MAQASIADLLRLSREAGVTVRVDRHTLVMTGPPEAQSIMDELSGRRLSLVRHMLRNRLLPTWPEPGTPCQLCGAQGQLRREPNGWQCGACQSWRRSEFRAMQPLPRYRRAWPEMVSAADTDRQLRDISTAVDHRRPVAAPAQPTDPCLKCGGPGFHPPCRLPPGLEGLPID